MKPAKKRIPYLLNFIGKLDEVGPSTHIQGIKFSGFCAKDSQFCKNIPMGQPRHHCLVDLLQVAGVPNFLHRSGVFGLNNLLQIWCSPAYNNFLGAARQDDAYSRLFQACIDLVG